MNPELSATVLKTETPSMMDILIECERRGLTPLQADWFLDGAVTARHQSHVYDSKRVQAWAQKGKAWMLSEIQSRSGV